MVQMPSDQPLYRRKARERPILLVEQLLSVSTRLPRRPLVLAPALIGVGLLVAALLDSSWPVWLCVAAVVAYGARPALYQWQHRRELGALRRARRRIVSTYNAWELGSMAGATPAALVDLVSAQCDAADREGRHLFIEVDEADQMAPAWKKAGFEPVE